MGTIIKRSGQAEAYDRNKIASAVAKAFSSTNTAVSDAALEAITGAVESRMLLLSPPVSVEQIQDLVEETLMQQGYFAQSKSYILYRSERTRMRGQRKSVCSLFSEPDALDAVLARADAALYKAKADGRNRVVGADPPPDDEPTPEPDPDPEPDTDPETPGEGEPA